MTATLTNPVTEAIEALVDAPISDADLVTFLADISRHVNDTARSLTAPMTHDQRKALVAGFTEVFGSETKAARKVFTRLALGLAPDAPVSWAQGGDTNGQGALTARQASKVLDALTALETAL
jgi:hypothetical protein